MKNSIENIGALTSKEFAEQFENLLHSFNHYHQQVVVRAAEAEAVVEWQYGTPCSITRVKELNAEGYDEIISKVTKLAEANEIEKVFIDSL